MRGSCIHNYKQRNYATSPTFNQICIYNKKIKKFNKYLN